MRKLVCGLIVIVLYIGSVLFAGQVWAIDYPLAYPGILPDSPIYFLKVARDQLVLWLVQDPAQKASYLVLLSDKRLAAGESLINRGKKDVGAMSVVKAEEYFSQAVEVAMVARQKGGDTSDLFAKLMVSSAKHTEVIDGLSVRVSGKDLEQVAKARRENEKSRNRVREIFFQAMGV